MLAAQPGRTGNFNTATLLFKGVPVVPSTPEGRVLVSVGGDRDRLVTLVVVGPSTFYPRVQPVRRRSPAPSGSIDAGKSACPSGFRAQRCL
ncbi:MAG: hypothetical protein KME03_05225 [Aphanocapsa lilacina HA4352-LM1]|nr:hypothetical protein [Aphanocapsa lilacina HA4352-LM1]